MTDGAAGHWESVYTRKEPEQVSWFEADPTRSLALIESAGLRRDAAILDVGGGASRLAARLAAGGYTDITVADISSAALEHARAQAAGVAEHITWVEADIRTHEFARACDLWHDRAVFHFMVSPHDRDRYLALLRRTLRRGGHLMLATFGPQGPQQCSGLPTARYDAAGLAALLGPDFTRVSSRLATHRTPASVDQQFLYTHFVHGGPPAAASSASGPG